MAKILEAYAKRLKSISKSYNRKVNPISKDRLKDELNSVIRELKILVNRT